MWRALIMIVIACACACAPSVPSELPATSPASEAAQTGPSSNVGVALREDPPLPDEDASAWAGLGASGGEHTGHTMHDMSAMGDGGMMMMMTMDGGMMHHGH